MNIINNEMEDFFGDKGNTGDTDEKDQAVFSTNYANRNELIFEEFSQDFNRNDIIKISSFLDNSEYLDVEDINFLRKILNKYLKDIEGGSFKDNIEVLDCLDQLDLKSEQLNDLKSSASMINNLPYETMAEEDDEYTQDYDESSSEDLEEEIEDEADYEPEILSPGEIFERFEQIKAKSIELKEQFKKAKNQKQKEEILEQIRALSDQINIYR
jgi:hypothetical protein